MGRLRAGDDPADAVVLIRGRCRGRSDLGHADELQPIPGLLLRPLHRHPQQQVGEGKVSDQLPVAGQPEEVVDLHLAERRVLVQEVTQGGHGASVAQILTGAVTGSR
jgi:hypothetical protein